MTNKKQPKKDDKGLAPKRIKPRKPRKTKNR